MHLVRSIVLIGIGSSAEFVREALCARGHDVVAVETLEQCLRAAAAPQASLVVACLPLPEANTEALLRAAKQRVPPLEVIVLGREDGLEPHQALALGADEAIAEPERDLSHLLSAVGIALCCRRADAYLRYQLRKDSVRVGFDSIIAGDPSMQKVLREARRFCARSVDDPLPVALLSGEPGTGKRLIAQGIHHSGSRRTRPFLYFNCAAVAPHRIESELFGTLPSGSLEQSGLTLSAFDIAQGGTLHLDEVDCLPLGAQDRLLDILNGRAGLRTSADCSRPSNIQIIAASRPHLSARVAAGVFREELHARLEAVLIALPPLRQRGDDRVRLAEAFVFELCRQYGLPPRRLSAEAREHLKRQRWPGNVRELRGELERIVLMTKESTIQAYQFRGSSPVDAVPPAGSNGFLSLPPEGLPLEMLEREALHQALTRCDWNVSRAARFLSVTRQTLIYRMKKHRLCSPPRDGGEVASTVHSGVPAELDSWRASDPSSA